MNLCHKISDYTRDIRRSDDSLGYRWVADRTVRTAYGPSHARFILFIVRWSMHETPPPSWPALPMELRNAAQALHEYATSITACHSYNTKGIISDLASDEERGMESRLAAVRHELWMRLYGPAVSDLDTPEMLYMAARSFNRGVFKSASEIDRLGSELVWSARSVALMGYLADSANKPDATSTNLKLTDALAGVKSFQDEVCLCSLHVLHHKKVQHNNACLPSQVCSFIGRDNMRSPFMTVVTTGRIAHASAPPSNVFDWPWLNQYTICMTDNGIFNFITFKEKLHKLVKQTRERMKDLLALYPGVEELMEADLVTSDQHEKSDSGFFFAASNPALIDVQNKIMEQVLKVQYFWIVNDEVSTSTLWWLELITHRTTCVDAGKACPQHNTGEHFLP